MSAPVLGPLVAALDARMHVLELLLNAETHGQFRMAADNGESASLQAIEKHITTMLSMPPSQTSLNAGWALGSELARVYVKQCGWSVVESNASLWIEKAQAHLDQATAQLSGPSPSAALLQEATPLVRLAMLHAMGEEAVAHPEYFRVTVGPSVPRLGASVVSALYSAYEVWGLGPSPVADAMAELLDGISLHIALYSTVYRTLVAKLHMLCMRALFSPYATSTPAAAASPSRRLQNSMVQLLAQLHLTGSVSSSSVIEPITTQSHISSGKVSQASLWAATFTEMLDAAILAVVGCAPSVDWRDHGLDAAFVTGRPLAWEPAPVDFVTGIPLNQARVALLLGDTTVASEGLLTTFLSHPTPRAVPLPLPRLMALAKALVRVRHSVESGRAPVDQLRLENAALGPFHILGLHLLLQIATRFQEASWRYISGSGVLSDVVILAERSHGAEQCASLMALQVLLAREYTASGVHLAGAQVPMDPSSPWVQRIARLTTQVLSNYLVQPSSSWSCAVPLKRSRTFESDSVLSASRSTQDMILTKPQDDVAGTAIAASLFCSVFPWLASSAAPGHRDLARVGLLALLGVAEAMVDGRLVDGARDDLIGLAVQTTAALTRIMVDHMGALIAHTLPRVHALLSRGMLSPVPSVRCACTEAMSQVLVVLRPRVPPLVDVVDNTALEERVDDLDAADHVPLPLSGWRGSAAALKDHEHIASVLPAPEPRETVLEAPPAETPVPAPVVPEAPAAVPAQELPVATLPAQPHPIDKAPSPAVAPAPAAAPQSPRVATASAPLPAPDFMEDTLVDSDDEALPALDMEESDDNAD